eukprot:gene21505-12564_t
MAAPARGGPTPRAGADGKLPGENGFGFVSVVGLRAVYLHITQHPFYDGQKGLSFKEGDKVKFTVIKGHSEGQGSEPGGDSDGGDGDDKVIRNGTLSSFFPRNEPPSGRLRDTQDGTKVYVELSELPPGYKPREGDEFEYEEVEDERGRKYALDATLVRRAAKKVFPRQGAVVKTEAEKRYRSDEENYEPAPSLAPSRSRARRDPTPSHRRPPPELSVERGEGDDEGMAEPVGSIAERAGVMMHAFLAAGGGMPGKSVNRSTGRSMR